MSARGHRESEKRRQIPRPGAHRVLNRPKSRRSPRKALVPLRLHGNSESSGCRCGEFSKTRNAQPNGSPTPEINYVDNSAIRNNGNWTASLLATLRPVTPSWHFSEGIE